MRSTIINRALCVIALPLLLACESTPGVITASPTANVAATVPIPATVPAIRVETVIAANTPTRVVTKVASATPLAATPVMLGVNGGWYSLSLGEALTLPGWGVTIRFQAVMDDSRCPRNPTLYCRRAGEATVAFAVTDGSGSAVFSLTMPGMVDEIAQGSDYPKGHVSLKGYEVQLISLKPYPGGDSDTTTLSPAVRPTPTPPLPPIATIFIAVAP